MIRMLVQMKTWLVARLEVIQRQSGSEDPQGCRLPMTQVSGRMLVTVSGCSESQNLQEKASGLIFLLPGVESSGTVF
ncbi:uncharacterized protein LOC101166397 isoform X2 [Oryzias latipes]